MPRPRPLLHRLPAWVALALVLALLPAAPALADAFPGGQFGRDAQSTKASHTADGPVAPELDWVTDLTGYQLGGGTTGELTFDSEGHVLFQGRSDLADPSDDALVALDREGGEIAWSVVGIDSTCGVAASDDGLVYALQGTDPQGPRTLVAIDAATGEVATRYDPTDEGQAPLGGGCTALRLAEDGTLISLGSTGFEARMHAIDTTDGLALQWVREYNDDGPGADDENTAELARPIISADGSAVYVCAEVLARDRPGTDVDGLVLEKLDLATGEVTAEIPIPQEGSSCNGPGVIAVDGGVIVSTAQNGNDDVIMRIVDAGTDLEIAWDTVFSRDEAVDESGLLTYPGGGSLSLAGDRIVFREAGFGVYHALDATTGDVEWTYRASQGHNSYDNIAVDADGDMYIPSTGNRINVESFDAQGNRRWIADLPALHGRDDLSGAKFVTVGPEGRIFLRLTGPGNDVAIAALRNGVDRVAGDDDGGPADVARQISRRLFADDAARTVVLARDDVFADALAGAPLAGAHSPILYTTGGPDAPLDDATRDEIDRVLPDGAIVRILGGPDAVSTLVADELTAAGHVVERFAGASRVETAALIAEVVVAEAPEGSAAGTAVLAFAGNWPDASTGGAWAAAAGAPILLTYADQLHPVTAQSMQDLGISETIVLGGTAVIGQEAAAAAPDAERIAGSNRMGTAAAITQHLWPRLPDGEEGAFVATNLDIPTGWAFALAASPLSARTGAPQLGVYADRYPDETQAVLSDLSLEGDGGLLAIGGESIIAADVIDQLIGDIRR